MKTIHFCLNGSEVKAEIDPGLTLLDMLRETFGLTGTKRGCEVGECGACTVLVDNTPMNSCMILAPLVNGKEVMTIEGLQNGLELHPIQQAFIDEGAVQCGFCTPGMLLSTYVLLQENPEPDRELIKNKLAGHFCRCGAYEQIIRAVQKAGQTMLLSN